MNNQKIFINLFEYKPHHIMQPEIDIELQKIPVLNNIEINNISIQNNSFGLFYKKFL